MCVTISEATLVDGRSGYGRSRIERLGMVFPCNPKSPTAPPLATHARIPIGTMDERHAEEAFEPLLAPRSSAGARFR